MMKKIFIVCLCTVSFSAAGPFFQTGAIAQNSALTVAFAHWPPWNIIDEKRFGGIDSDILKAVGEPLNIRFEFKECPWQRCVEMIRTGDADLITSFGKTRQREAFAIYLALPYTRSVIHFYGLKQNKLQVNSFEDLYGKSIGVTKGSAFFDRFDRDEKLKKVEVTRMDQILKMALSRRIDLFIGFERATEYRLLTRGLDHHFEKMAYSKTGYDLYVGMSRKSDHLKWAPLISERLTHLVTSGETQQIINRFLDGIKVPDPENKD